MTKPKAEALPYTPEEALPVLFNGEAVVEDPRLRATVEEVEARYTMEEAFGALETAFERGMDPGEFAALLAQIRAARKAGA